MANLSITAADVQPVVIRKSYTGPAKEAIAAGEYCRFNVTDGQVESGNGSTAAEARPGGIALKTVAIGETVTFVADGILDVGAALAALTYDDIVYLSDTDALLADTAGTVSLVVGRVIPGWQNTTPDKLLEVQL